MPKMPQMDLIAELKKRQVKPQVREGKDGALEDIITGNMEHYFKHMMLVCSAFEIHIFCLRFEKFTIQENRWPASGPAPGHLSRFWTVDRRKNTETNKLFCICTQKTFYSLCYVFSQFLLYIFCVNRI